MYVATYTVKYCEIMMLCSDHLQIDPEGRRSKLLYPASQMLRYCCTVHTVHSRERTVCITVPGKSLAPAGRLVLILRLHLPAFTVQLAVAG